MPYVLKIQDTETGVNRIEIVVDVEMASTIVSYLSKLVFKKKTKK